MNNTYVAIGVVAALVLGGFVYKSSMSGGEMMEAKEAPALAITDSNNGAMMKEDMSTSSMNDNAMMKLGVVLSSGKIMLDEGGEMSPITGDYTFKSGLKVMTSGKVMRVDGTTFMLKEGQSIWQDGSVMEEKMMDMPTTNGETMMKEETMMMPDTSVKGNMTTGESMTKDTMMAKAGSYIPYDSAKLAMAKTGNVVLFFRAAWCPTCRNVDNDIKSHLSSIPANLTILDVNYDEAKDLKVKYGVTYQHTFVEVDASGVMLKKWSGSPTLAALVAEVK